MRLFASGQLKMLLLVCAAFYGGLMYAQLLPSVMLTHLPALSVKESVKGTGSSKQKTQQPTHLPARQSHFQKY